MSAAIDALDRFAAAHADNPGAAKYARDMVEALEHERRDAKRCAAALAEAHRVCWRRGIAGWAEVRHDLDIFARRLADLDAMAPSPLRAVARAVLTRNLDRWADTVRGGE